MLEVDSKINNFLIKINTNQEDKESKIEIQDQKIKEFVLYILVKYNRYGNGHGLNKEKIASEMINIWKCSAEKAEKILSYLDGLGLRYCKKFHDREFVYDFLEFAFMQQYVSPKDSFLEELQKLSAIQKRLNTESLRLNFAYNEKYGEEEKWSEEIFERQDKEYGEISKRYSREMGTITTKLLDSFSDQNLHETFVRFLDVFFAEKSLQTVNAADTQ